MKTHGKREHSACLIKGVQRGLGQLARLLSCGDTSPGDWMGVLARERPCVCRDGPFPPWGGCGWGGEHCFLGEGPLVVSLALWAFWISGSSADSQDTHGYR